jgi:hypothetical protein
LSRGHSSYQNPRSTDSNDMPVGMCSVRSRWTEIDADSNHRYISYVNNVSEHLSAAKLTSWQNDLALLYDRGRASSTGRTEDDVLPTRSAFMLDKQQTLAKLSPGRSITSRKYRLPKMMAQISQPSTFRGTSLKSAQPVKVRAPPVKGVAYNCLEASNI